MTRHDPNKARPARAAKLIAGLGCALLLSMAEARAGAFHDVSLGLDVGDDARVFLNLTNDYYAPPATVATRVVRRCPRPENDYPVILLLARASHRPADQVLDLWLTNRSWADIMFELRVPPSVLFVGLNRDPGPPYGKAWGRWKQHRGKGPVPLSDRDVVELAKLQIASGYYHANPYSLITERQKGVRIEAYAANRYRAKHGDEKAAGRQGKEERGQGKGASKGHGGGPKEKHKGH
jgi:hypothetical protein